MTTGFVFDFLFMTGKVIDGSSIVLINSLATLLYMSSFAVILFKLFKKQEIDSSSTTENVSDTIKNSSFYQETGMSFTSFSILILALFSIILLSIFYYA